MRSVVTAGVADIDSYGGQHLHMGSRVALVLGCFSRKRLNNPIQPQICTAQRIQLIGRGFTEDKISVKEVVGVGRSLNRASLADCLQ